jgi:hypothetical protein
MQVIRNGDSYRVAFDSGLRHVLLGLIPAVPGTSPSPQVIALRQLDPNARPAVDATKMKEQVLRALADVGEEVGTGVGIDAIEYVPDNSPYYEKYYELACILALHIAADR